MSHHGDDLNVMKEMIAGLKLGATGKFPQGHLNEQDEGEIRVAVAADPQTQKVIIQFGKSVSWIGFTAEQASDLADTLRDKSLEARPTAGLNPAPGVHQETFEGG